MGMNCDECGRDISQMETSKMIEIMERTGKSLCEYCDPQGEWLRIEVVIKREDSNKTYLSDQRVVEWDLGLVLDKLKLTGLVGNVQSNDWRPSDRMRTAIKSMFKDL